MADRDRMACLGATTIPVRSGHEHHEQCRECRTSVAWDFVDHPFFGFANACSQSRNTIVPRYPADSKMEGDKK